MKLKRALAQHLTRMWKNTERVRTLARIVEHERQFEAWWKFELATSLWDLADDHELGVFVECFARADVSLGRFSGKTIDLARTPRVPIELKTTGTFWSGGTKKALRGGEKSLHADLDALASGARNAHPFGVVALLVTHAGKMNDRFPDLVHGARQLGDEHGLEVLVDQPIAMPGRAAAVHQLAWLK